MGTVKFRGIVVSGQGNGKKYLQLIWVKKQIQEKLGYTVYPGTLNVKLNKESAKRRNQLKNAQAVQICPAKGYCFGSIYKAILNGVECAVVVPEVKGYPENILEIIATVYLRGILQLKDGSHVTVLINI